MNVPTPGSVRIVRNGVTPVNGRLTGIMRMNTDQDDPAARFVITGSEGEENRFVVVRRRDVIDHRRPEPEGP